MAGAAKFISIKDLLAISNPSQTGMIRIIGRLEKYDIKNSIIWIQDHNTPSLQVAVNSSNIEPFPSKVGVLYQFIGEADYRVIPNSDDSVKCVMLNALVYRCTDGLDLNVYLKSHMARMRDLEQESFNDNI